MARKSKGTHLKQRGENGYFYIHWCEGSRDKKRSTGTRDREEAEQILAGFIQERAKQEASGDVMTVGRILVDYYEEHVLKHCAAPGRQELCIRNLSPLHDIKITQLDAEYINDYCEERSVKDSTLRRELNTLTAAINHSVRNRRLNRADAPHIALPPDSPSKDRWLSNQEEEALLAATMYETSRAADGRFNLVQATQPTRCYIFCMLALHTASRKRALEELRWCQIDMEHRLIDLNPPGRAQTAKRRPVVPISDELFEMLEQINPDNDMAFVLGHSGNIRKTFTTAVERAGLEDVTPHTLRHTWATQAARAGVPLWEIAGVLGDDEATVRKNYLHHCPGHLRGAVNFRRKA